ncbi:MAG TPA: hypothetical protein VGS41_09715 [Chthonomonadales bacterium]|nr:hypothetical protein [Chthonomonadales bacterium]
MPAAVAEPGEYLIGKVSVAIEDLWQTIERMFTCRQLKYLREGGAVGFPPGLIHAGGTRERRKIAAMRED